MSSDSLLDKEYISGLYGGKGYTFEGLYILSELPEWLNNNEVISFQGEVWSDFELFFTNGKRWLVQVKDHALDLTEFRDIIANFSRRYKGDKALYEKFVIVSVGAVDSVQAVINGLKRWKDIENLPAQELAGTKAALTSSLQEKRLPDNFLIENISKIELDTERGWLKDRKRALADFRNLMQTHFRISTLDAENLYSEIGTQLSTVRGQQIPLLPIRERLHRRRPIEPNYLKEFDELLDSYNQSFVGRAAELDRIMQLAVEENPSCLMIEAPLGFGKSALVAQIIHKYQANQWSGARPNLLYYFIQKETPRANPKMLLRSFNYQLGKLLDTETDVQENDLIGLYERFQSLWAETISLASKESPVLLLIDGLDELDRRYLSELRLVDLLPQKLARYAHIVIATRPDSELQSTLAIRYPNAQRQGLLPLSEYEIQQLLNKLGADEAQATHLAPSILEITKGEPLLVRYVSEDTLTDEGRLDEFRNNPPKNVEDYFLLEAKYLKDVAHEADTWSIVKLLADTYGPITDEEISEVLNLSKRAVRDALDKIKRFLRTETKIQFERRELRDKVRGELAGHERRNIQEKILNWCKQYETDGWPSGTPGYVLRHYVQYLEQSGGTVELYQLVENDTWTETKIIDGFGIDSLAQDLNVASTVALRAFQQDNVLGDWIRAMSYQARRALVENIRPSNEAILFLAKLGDTDSALAFARRVDSKRYHLIKSIAQLVEPLPKKLEIYIQLAHLADSGYALNQCQNRLAVAREILQKFPPTYRGKADDLVKEAMRREAQIPSSQRDDYELNYVLPVKALFEGVEAVEPYIEELPVLEQIRATCLIILALQENDSNKLRLAEKILLKIKQSELSALLAVEAIRTVAYLLPLFEESEQNELLDLAGQSFEYLLSMDEPDRELVMLTWSAIERIAQVNAKCLRWIRERLEKSNFHERQTPDEIIPEIAKVNWEEALEIWQTQPKSLTSKSVLIDIIRVVANQDPERAQDLINKYENELKNDLEAAYLALAEGYLTKNKEKARDIFNSHAFKMDSHTTVHESNELQMQVLLEAAEFLELEQIHASLMDFPQCPHCGRRESKDTAIELLGRLAVNQNKVHLIEDLHLGSLAEIQAVYQMARNGEVQQARAYWNEWHLQFINYASRSCDHLNTFIDVAEAVSNADKLDIFLKHYDEVQKPHKHLCEHIIQLPQAISQLVISMKIEVEKAKSIIELAFSFLAKWKCPTETSLSNCLCRYKNTAIAQLVGTMYVLDTQQAQQMLTLPIVESIKILLLKQCLAYASYLKDFERTKTLYNEIIDLIQQTVDTPLERAEHYYSLAALLPPSMKSEANHLINLAEPLLMEARNQLSLQGRVAKGKTFIKLIHSIEQFGDVYTAISSVTEIKDKLDILKIFIDKTLGWDTAQKHEVLVKIWQLAEKSGLRNVLALVVCSIPIVHSLDPDRANGFWNLYRKLQWSLSIRV